MAQFGGSFGCCLPRGHTSQSDARDPLTTGQGTLGVRPGDDGLCTVGFFADQKLKSVLFVQMFLIFGLNLTHCAPRQNDLFGQIIYRLGSQPPSSCFTTCHNYVDLNLIQNMSVERSLSGDL